MRIGIVNDMPLAVEALRRAISVRPEHEIVWVARDGAEAVVACARETPDLVLMDLVMPGMDGVEATRRIMAGTPCAILVVTFNVGTNAWRVFDAMAQGALDAVDTPQLGVGDARSSAALLLAKIDTIGKRIAVGFLEQEPKPQPVPAGRRPSRQLVAIGASAGGPGALAKLLGGLPPDFPGAVVIVQHVDEQFASGMAEWLNQYSSLPVKIAEEGDAPIAGAVLLAASDDHLTLKSADRLGYTPEPRDYVYRPSVDVFFRSVCRYWCGEAIGVLLTGMGRDGAEGLKELRDSRFHTIAQDEATSAVYGMPKAAAKLGAAVEILPLGRIAFQLAALFPGQSP